ncbi:LysR substrate-binding domain-containing protein [Agrobacterium tumefaciens]|uniref:LysR substrate-binding domain-containing protein n=1 Tax=Agrobacterium tumefaciens TaxID=358 RepID=UPI0021D1906F|nr:LysR substrate-binding domain-containing protein [Agrobacterium tumefaciens]UXS01876.1 LysR family transcriptional regulator [Agrobacterium tumefaciens]HEE4992854.1 LysR family transcriptional regulator [Klebsiella pneumoniae]
MDNLNDLAYFVAVVDHGGFSAAARATGLEKTRLSRRIAALESRLGVRLLQRSTRRIALTEAGERFFVQARTLVEGAQSVYDSVADLRREPSGTIRLTCPQVMAQNYLAPILPGYLVTHPKVKLELDASDRHIDLLKERFDLALRAHVKVEDTSGLVARELGQARRVLVASPALLDAIGRPEAPEDLSVRDTISRLSDVHDGQARWALNDPQGRAAIVPHVARLSSDDLRMQLEAAIHGVGIALLPEPIVSGSVRRGLLEVVLPQWAATAHVIHLLYPPPRGMLPSVRSLIDYLTLHLPASIQQRSVDAFDASR